MVLVSVSESELIAQSQQGDRNAFNELVRIHHQGVIGVVYRMCGDAQLAEDAAQEAFIQAWLKITAYQPKASLKSWIYRIAINAAIDVLRHESRITSREINDLQLRESGPGPEGSALNSEQTDLIQAAVLSLPEASRAVLVLREYQDLSYQEIAAALDIPLGTVMSRLSYARKLLRERLEPHLVYAEVANV
ncbi:MAG: sigma-70 family RNA polymerase sigma factor [Anaerolineales bacterium]|nr:sigma-70 family RNA polymerase sigma factor [Anaerolineales bacterium]